jgi:phage FluMu gp28-like protein
MQIDLAIKNFKEQQTIFDSKARYKIVAKGRRFGLTKGAANDFIKCALERKFKAGLWVDTVNANIDRYVERYFVKHLKRLPEGTWSWRKQAKILEIFDSYIDFRSADRPENIEGFGYDKAFLNEAGIILKNDYLWENAIRPMLWEYKAATVIGGTPKGMGKFHELFMRGEDPAQLEYQSFRFSSFDNPYWDHAELEAEMSRIPENVVKQEIYAEFLEDTGVVFKRVLEVATALPQQPKVDHLYVMGVDLARVQDYTVITVYDRKTNEQVYQDRFNNLDWSYQKQKIKAVSDHYNKALVLIDATGLGDPIADDLARAGVPIEPIHLTNEMKKEIIEKMATWIELKRLAIINLKETLNEFNSFTYDISSTGKVRYNAPVGFHDDIVVAHCLAVWSLQPFSTRVYVKPKTPIQISYQRALNNFYEGESETW